MARPLIEDWPPYSDSLGTPDTGTDVDAELLDAMRDTIAEAIYNEDLDEGPPEIAAEMVAARAAYATLAARLTAIDVAAAGGAATVAAGGAAPNVVPNDAFLIWPGGDNVAPAYWTKESDLTVLRVTLQGDGDAKKIAGRNMVRLQSTGATNNRFYCDIISDADISTYGAAPIASLLVAAGIYIKCDDASAVKVYVDDGVSPVQVGTNLAQTNWVWSPTQDTDVGKATLSASATRMRLVIRVDNGSTCFLAGAYLGITDSAPAYQPTPVMTKDFVYSTAAFTNDAAPVASTILSTFLFGTPTYIIGGQAYATTAPASTALVVNTLKDTVEVFSTALGLTGTQTTGTARTAATVAKASFGVTNVFKLSLGANIDGALRGVNIRLRILQYVDPVIGLFGGRVVAN